jgi:hypothetical protein
MAARKNTRRMSCKSKDNQFPTHAAATWAMHDVRRRLIGGIETNTSVYPCGDHFHFGHTRSSKR